MQQTQPVENHDQRILDLINSITKNLYTNICRGLFEAHKLIYSFLFTSSINRQDKELDDSLWSVFLRGAGLFDRSIIKANPDKNVITELSWDLVYYLSIHFEKFATLPQNIIDKWSSW